MTSLFQAFYNRSLKQDSWTPFTNACAEIKKYASQTKEQAKTNSALNDAVFEAEKSFKAMISDMKDSLSVLDTSTKNNDNVGSGIHETRRVSNEEIIKALKDKNNTKLIADLTEKGVDIPAVIAELKKAPQETYMPYLVALQLVRANEKDNLTLLGDAMEKLDWVDPRS